jgi:hypothetical protein
VPILDLCWLGREFYVGGGYEERWSWIFLSVNSLPDRQRIRSRRRVWYHAASKIIMVVG